MATLAGPQNRFLDPAVLAEVSSMELVAKTVVDGFVAGLHRSPDFGGSSGTYPGTFSWGLASEHIAQAGEFPD